MPHMPCPPDTNTRDDAFDVLPGVTALDRRGDVVTLTSTDPETTLRALLEEGRRLPDLEVRGASLEDAVLSLTRSIGAPR